MRRMVALPLGTGSHPKVPTKIDFLLEVSHLLPSLLFNTCRALGSVRAWRGCLGRCGPQQVVCDLEGCGLKLVESGRCFAGCFVLFVWDARRER